MCEERSIYNKNREKHKNRIMNFEIIQSVIQDAVKFGLKEIIPSTMGEPLLYPHFEHLLGLVKDYGLKLNLTTNGTFPKLGVKKWGELILPVASDVKISINGATKETAESIMIGINFENQLANIANLIEIRDEIRAQGINYPTLTFQITFMEKNLGELVQLLKLAIDMDVDRVKGHHLWLTWPELQDESLRRNGDSISRWNAVVEELKLIADKSLLKNGKKIKLDNFYTIPMENLKKIIPQEGICPFLGREAWIAWDGTFNVCCAPDNLRQSLGYFGNVNNQNFMELWTGKDYSRLIQNWGNYDVCQECNMRRPISDVLVC
jgi:MoaA/NifB/PqqE/SkfB family radical SAM enzyme